MAIFGTINVVINSNYTIKHTGNETDVLMNDICGAIFVPIVLIGLILNTYLFYYHYRYQTSWASRCFIYLAVAQLGYTIVRTIPTTYYLLSQGEPVVPKKHGLLFVSYLLGFPFGLSMVALVGILAIVQFSQIHLPFWAIVNGTWLKKAAFTGCMVFCLCWSVTFALFQSFLPGNCTWLNAVQLFCSGSKSVFLLLAVLPFYLGVIVSAILYLITILKFHKNSELVLSQEIRRDFIVLGFLMLGNVLWVGLDFYDLAHEWFKKTIDYDDLYLMFITFTLVPCLVSAYNALVIFSSDQEMRQRLLSSICRRRDRGYLTIE